MKIKTDIQEGESKRVIAYKNGKKGYLPLKAGKWMEYSVCHSRDLRLHGTDSD